MKILGLRYRFVLALMILPFVFCIIAMSSSAMKVQYVYKILPVFIGSNADILNDGSAAIQRGIFIFIEPTLFNNEEIIQHELVHVKRYYRTISYSYWASLFSEKYLADVEAEAYVLKAKSPKDFDRLAQLIKTEYSPEVDKEYIISRLYLYWSAARR